MCGIAGILNFDGKVVRPEQLSAMTNRMIERGPDDEGFYRSGSVGLGFRRLSIIDLATGHQPLQNEDEALQLVFNGEIYNHIELRDQLVRRGHIFRTQSDAEVLLHLYEEKGIAALDDLNGMFAFALYDKRKNALLIARDRLGIKPLFYATSPQKFVFASDIRALRTEISAKIDSVAVLKYLALAYVPATGTMLNGVQKLLPGHYMLVKADGNIAIEKYWALDPPHRWHGSLAEARTELDMHLDDAIRLQMRSDVPVGIFLSGGLDSSALVAYASKFSREPLRTYTVNFAGKDSEDVKFAHLVAGRYETNHFDIQFDFADVAGAIDDLLPRMDEPISDSAIFPAYLLSKAARQHGVKVLLNGAGGDEIFGGYRRHWPPQLGSPAWVAETLSGPLGKLLSNVWTLFQPARGMRASNPVFSWACSVSGVDLSACKYLLRDSTMFHQVINAVMEEYSEITHMTTESNYTYQRMGLDLNTYLPGDVLAATDKATMAASVECRVPLLDHNLVEFAYSLPPEVNLTGRSPKGLFRDVLASRLPSELLNRRKEGFNAPVTEWMQTGGVLNIRDELLGQPVDLLSDLFSSKALEELCTVTLKSSQASETLFSLFLLNRWCRAQED